MKPYTLTLTSEEMEKVRFALDRGLFCGRQLKQQGMIGADSYNRHIEAAIAIMNRAPAGGYETEQEASAAWMEKTIAECDRYGSN